jgi:AraC-like DNA-binding protein
MNARILWHARTPDGALRLIEYAPGTRQPAHAHDRASVTLVLCGDLVEGSEQGREHAAPLSVVAKPAGVEHENVFGPGGAHTLQIELPRNRRLGAASMSRASTHWEHAGPACRSLLRLLAVLDPSTLQTGRCGHDALVHRTLAGLTFASASEAAPPAWLIALRLALAHESTPIAALARRFGVHRVYLARRFRAQLGVSPAAYRARLRVQQAARAMLEANVPLATVALDAGYYDQPHMNRRIRAATGLSPRALRKLSDGLRLTAPAIS